MRAELPYKKVLDISKHMVYNSRGNVNKTIMATQYKVTFINEAAEIKLNTLRGSEKQKAWANSLRQNVIDYFRGKVDDDILGFVLNTYKSAVEVIDGRRIFSDVEKFSNVWEEAFKKAENTVRINTLAKKRSIRVFIPKEYFQYDDVNKSVIKYGVNSNVMVRPENANKLSCVLFKSPETVDGGICYGIVTPPLFIAEGSNLRLRVFTDDWKLTEDGVFVTIDNKLDAAYLESKYRTYKVGGFYYDKSEKTNVKAFGLIVDYFTKLGWVI